MTTRMASRVPIMRKIALMLAIAMGVLKVTVLPSAGRTISCGLQPHQRRVSKRIMGSL
jgi:hypothetical protein